MNIQTETRDLAECLYETHVAVYLGKHRAETYTPFENLRPDLQDDYFREADHVINQIKRYPAPEIDFSETGQK